ncbi:MAG TPA: acyl-CoA dehydrogenase family protein [Microthrixaceae bacterium]|nr:acyl-CoA/acyl-ACP dehydrogenase [Microthrixaceae bacterium]RTL08840.1 MAG: acyl-CoA dehydrogenase [Acidimicrobiia bacterium]MCB9375968.1 acyl-CoA/acyl-ACP dehydrogenase [Microthrixaceae bacterium]MCB9400179.1 acyl-CoA/acyl-ACP dehydrogenase [Microthrixaceae bacterium]MCO5304503.1 acyl-CoA/acyl-ACP dehydrogenase [Microthrixaceae bacterium]
MHDLQDRLAAALPTVRAGADAADADAKFPAESVRALADAGLMGLTLPTEVGGLGAGPVELVAAVSAVAAECGSTAMVHLMHLASAMVAAAAPPTAGGAELLADMAAGTALGTLAFSEKGSRSHFWAPVSKAVAADGAVRIRADKSWVTSASNADVYITSTLAPAATAATESDLYVVPRISDGVSIAGRFDGLGLRGNDSAPVRLDVEVPTGARLGAHGTGFALMMEVVLPWFSLGNSAVSLGLARAALERAIGHASAARFDHLDSALSDLPTIRAYLAKAWTDLSAHEALLRETAARVAEPDDTTVLAVLATKAGCNEAALRVTETALRVTGGAGFSRQVGVDRPYRDARAGFVMAPTSDALFDFTGRALCGLDLF